MITFSVPGVPVERLREVFLYDPETGRLVWRIQRGRRGVPGRSAGSVNGNGYLSVGLDGVRSMAVHRVIWAMVHGHWPTLEVDHVNGDKLDNRIENLRLVTTAENHENLRRARSDNKTGILGVSRFGNRFRAQIQAKGKKYWLGEFATAEEAQAAYIKAKRELHPRGTL